MVHQMSIYTRKTMSSHRRARSGTATIETLMIMIPTWIFFMLCLSVMNYWETQYLDNAVELENQFARHTVTGLFLPTGSSGSPIPSSDSYEYYLVEKNDSPSEYYAYVKDKTLNRSGNIVKGRHKIMTVRGTTTWTSFIWMRGQHAWLSTIGGFIPDTEGGKRESWFSDMGADDLDEQREFLWLGS
jgi:hypothetical protein